MNEISDNKYNINIFNISYGLQENLGKKLENKIQGITDRKNINKVFIDSSDISAEDSNMNYYEQLLESIKGESNNNENNNNIKSKNSSPLSPQKKNVNSIKKNYYPKEFKKRLMEHNGQKEQENNENLLCLNKEYHIEKIPSNIEDVSQLNSNSNIEQNHFFKYKANSSAKNLDDKFFLEDSNLMSKDNKLIKYSENDLTKYVNNMNFSQNHSSVGTPVTPISTPKSHKHYSKYKKVPRHSTFLIDEEHKKEKSDKKRNKSIFISNEDDTKNYNNNNNLNNNYNNNGNNNNGNNNFNLIEQFVKKKTIKLKKNDEIKKSNIISNSNEKQYNNNFISNIHSKKNSINNTLNIEKKKKTFLCCITIG